MNERAELWLMRGEQRLHTEPVGPRGVRLGRAPDNDLVLQDPGVSGHHALIAWINDRLVLTDLASRNGTTVDDRPVTGRQELADGAVVVLGGRLTLRVRLGAVGPVERAWSLEVGDGELRLPLRSDRFRVGSAPGADLHVAGAAPEEAVVLVVGDEVRLATELDDVPLTEGVPVEVAGLRLTLRRTDAALAATVPLARTTFGYVLDATLHGPTGPTASLADPATGRSHTLSTENRAVLLWLLGRRRQEDPREEGGWCTDEELLAGLWGRDGAGADPARVRVLLCRMRKELADAGLDGSCLEKKQGHLRIRVAEARIGDGRPASGVG